MPSVLSTIRNIVILMYIYIYMEGKGTFRFVAFRIMEKQENEILFLFFHLVSYILQTCELYTQTFDWTYENPVNTLNQITLMHFDFTTS